LAADLYKALVKVPKFKTALEVAGLAQCASPSKVPAFNLTTSAVNKDLQTKEETKQEDEGFSVLGKRKEPEKKLESSKPKSNGKLDSFYKPKSSAGKSLT
jgi:hypothetical protein